MSSATQLIQSEAAVAVVAPGGRALFTGRLGGVSEPPYDSLNLGPWTDDDPEAVRANHRSVEAMASADRPRTLVLGRQIHETGVARHLEGQPDPALDGVDGHVTDRYDLALGVLTADCVPVVLLAPWGVGAAHAGWRGLSAGVIEEAVAQLCELPGAGHSREIVAAIGPCAGPCCYEVGDEVHAAFAGRPVGRAEGRNIDLPTLAADALERAGVVEFVQADRCTICDPTYFSHRASGPATGRQAGVVWRA